MYDVLVYVFEHCQQTEVAHEADRVAKKLSAAGFEDSDISEALRWLAGVLTGPHVGLAHLPDAKRSFRAFSAREMSKLDVQCRGFLLTLEHSGILSPQTREQVIERSLAASGDSLTLEQLKLIVLMVMWNQQTPTSRLVAEDLFSTPHARLAS
jgi:Smg protein